MLTLVGGGRKGGSAGVYNPVEGGDVLGVPVWLMRCVEVKPGAKMVYAALAGMLDPAVGCVVTTRIEISEVTGLATGAVRKHVQELVRCGMLLVSGGESDLAEKRVRFVKREWMKTDRQIEGGGERDEMDGQ